MGANHHFSASRGSRAVPHREGFALLLVIIAVAMATTLALPFLVAQGTTTGVSQNILDQTKARYLAESGMELTLAYIRSDAQWRNNKTQGVWVENQSLSKESKESLTVTVEDGVDKNRDQVIGDGEGDGDLGNDPFDPFTILVTARLADGATYTLRNVVSVRISPITYIAAREKIEAKDDSVIDSFHSASGPYGGTNVGSEAKVAVNSIDKDRLKAKDRAVIKGSAYCGVSGNPNQVIKEDKGGRISGDADALSSPVPMPTTSDSTSMGASVGDVSYNSGENTLSSDLHCKHFKLEGAAVLKISGDVTVLADDDVEFKGTSRLELEPGARLRVYFRKKLKFKDDAQVNMGEADPGRVRFLSLGVDEVKFEQRAKVYATVVAPNSKKFELKDQSQFYGNLAARELHLEKTSRIHQDLSTGFYATNPILYAEAAVRDKTEVRDDATIDSFNSNQNLYDAANPGDDAWVATNKSDKDKIKVEDSARLNGSAYAGPGGDPEKVIKVGGSGRITGAQSVLTDEINVPRVDPPQDMPPSEGDLSMSTGKEFIDGDRAFHNLTLTGDAELRITAEARVYVEGTLTLDNDAAIRIMNGSSLELYVKDAANLKANAAINANTADPHRVDFYMVGKGNFTMAGNARVYGGVIGRDVELDLNESSQLFGTFQGKSIKLHNFSQFHADLANRPAPPNQYRYDNTWDEQL